MSTAWKPLGQETYRFDGFRIDPAARGLYNGEAIVPVPARVFDVILYFTEHAGQIVSKDELARYVWGEAAVADDNISQHIFLARKALGDTQRPHRYIVTVHGEGFRFIPEVTTSSGYIRAALGHDFEELERYTAQHLYRSGRHFLAMRTEASNASALDFFRRALETKPNTAEAYAGMAEAQWIRAVSFYGEPAENFAQAWQNALQAARTDPACADAHIAQAAVRFFSDFDTTAALRHLDMATELDATSPLVPALRVQVTSARAEHERASLFALEGMRRYPASSEIAAHLGSALYYAHDFETSIKHLTTVLSLDPTVSLGRYYLGISHWRVGNVDDARRHLSRAAQPELTLAPRFLWSPQQAAMAALCLVEARSGNAQRAEELQGWLREAPMLGARSHYAQALCHLAMNSPADCCSSLADAIAGRDPWAAFLAVDPLFDELRDEQAFQSLVQAVLIPRISAAR